MLKSVWKAKLTKNRAVFSDFVGNSLLTFSLLANFAVIILLFIVKK